LNKGGNLVKVYDSFPVVLIKEFCISDSLERGYKNCFLMPYIYIMKQVYLILVLKSL
jgi:hypothetical protein